MYVSIEKDAGEYQSEDETTGWNEKTDTRRREFRIEIEHNPQ